MSWITESECSFDFCLTFQKMIYRLYKLYGFDGDFFYDMLETHYQHWELLEEDKITIECYLEIIWKIVDNFNSKSKNMKIKNTTNIKRDMGILYGWITNKHKKIDLYN